MNFKIKIEDNKKILNAIDNSGSNNFSNELHIEGLNRRVYCFTAFGNGIPADVWHGLTVSFNLPKVVNAEKLLDFIEENAEKFEKYFDNFKAIWDGSNHEGRWFEEIVTPANSPLIDEELQFLINEADLGPEYIYEDEDHFIHEAWGDINTFLDEFPNKPKTKKDAYSLAIDILDSNDECVFCNFYENELAEYLFDERDEIWNKNN